MNQSRAATIWRPPASARRVALSPGAARAAALDAAGELTIVAPESQMQAARVVVDPDAAGIAISDDGTVVAVVDALRRVRVVPVERPESARVLAPLCGLLCTYEVQGAPTRSKTSVAPHDLVFAPDLRALLVTERSIVDAEMYYGGGSIESRSRTWLCRWPPGKSELLFTDEASQPITYRASDAEAEADHVVSAAFSPGGRWLALLSRRGRLALREVGSRGPAGLWGPHEAVIGAFAFVPGDAAMLVASGGRVATWDLEQGVERAAFTARGEVVALASCGATVACVDAAGEVSLFTSGGEPLDVLPGVHASPACGVSWIGDRVAIRCRDGALVTWA